jgi:thiol-disulfide isomerase/thioredoxin
MKTIIAALALLIGVAAPLSAEVMKPAARKAAPAFTLPAKGGSSLSLASLKGKVVLLDFWATWCAACKVEIPWFMEFQRAYKAQGLSAVGVALDDEGWTKVAPYLKQHPINYAIVVGDPALAERYAVTALPVTVLIDRSGKIAALHRGLVNKAAFERDLQQLLRER